VTRRKFALSKIDSGLVHVTRGFGPFRFSALGLPITESQLRQIDHLWARRSRFTSTYRESRGLSGVNSVGSEQTQEFACP
jgi:hypothetical protein